MSRTSGEPADATGPPELKKTRRGAEPVAVMSHRTGQRKYGLDPSVVGSTFTLIGQPFTEAMHREPESPPETRERADSCA